MDAEVLGPRQRLLLDIVTTIADERPCHRIREGGKLARAVDCTAERVRPGSSARSLAVYNGAAYAQPDQHEDPHRDVHARVLSPDSPPRALGQNTRGTRESLAGKEEGSAVGLLPDRADEQPSLLVDFATALKSALPRRNTSRGRRCEIRLAACEARPSLREPA
jgi:hypothetical protein